MISQFKSWSRAMPAGEVNITVASEPKEPPISEVLLMFAVVSAVHILAVCRAGSFWDLASTWGDNSQYLKIAMIIRQWRFYGAEMPWHFWGFPFVIAGISKLFAVPALKALVLISMVASLAVSVLVHRLYGGWVAVSFFFFINYQWIITSMEGGSESLFMCLLLASFLAARSGRWNLAALLASISTTVRPAGIFALMSFAAILAVRKSVRQLAAITLIGVTVGVLYFLPVWNILGTPFASFAGYRIQAGGEVGPQGWLITYPFGALIPSYLLGLRTLRWPIFPLPVMWLVLALAGVGAMWLPFNRQRFSPMIQPEALFASIYTLFLVSFNAKSFIAFGLPRYLIPALPMFLFSLRDRIPRDRRLLWGGAVLSALLSAAALVGFRNAFGFRLP